MINRNGLISIILLLIGLIAGYLISKGLSAYLSISGTGKDLGEICITRTPPDSGTTCLPMRMVDIGGVGVLPDTADWGNNYEHHQHYFEDVIRVTSPYIDSAAYSREVQKMESYAGKMSQYGFNAIALPWFLEFINFDKVGNGNQVYGKESIYRDRHTRLSEEFNDLMKLADSKGLRSYLWTDMVALTPPL